MGQEFPRCLSRLASTTRQLSPSDTVKKSKLRHIDARQDWVQALRDSELVKLVKVNMKDNYANLMTKILDPETSTNLRDGMMVNVAIPESIIEQSGTSSSVGVGNGQGPAAGKAGVQIASEKADGAPCGTGGGSEGAKRNGGPARRRSRKVP